MSNSFSIDSIHWRHFFLFLAIPVGLFSYEVHRDPAQRQDPFLQMLAARTPRWLNRSPRVPSECH